MARLEPLLEHADWLGKLAMRLVGPDADDVVQETWIAALRSPPDPDRPPRPWLAKVLHNTARMGWRSKSRRELRDGVIASQPRDQPRPDDALDLLEQVRMLCEAVERLPADARELIVLHYFERKQLKDIARHRGIPAGTVRWQHGQALALLRDQLDTANQGRRRQWVKALLPLAAPHASSTPLVLGGLLVKKILVLAIVLAVIVGACLLAFSTRASHRSDGAGSASQASSSGSPGSQASLTDGARGSSTLAGTVRDPGRAPIRDATVCAIAVPHDADEPPQHCARSGIDGAYELTGVKGGTYELTASAPSYLPAFWHHDADQQITARPGERRAGLDVTLVHGGVQMRGRVADIGGGNIAGAEVTLLTETGEHHRIPVVTRSGDDGTFEAWVGPGAIVGIARADGYAEDRDIARAPGTFLTILLTPESRLSGIVIDGHTKAPIADAEVVVGREIGIVVAGHSMPLDRRVVATTDLAGRFTLTGLLPGRYKPSAKLDGFTGLATRSVVLGLGQSVDDLVITASRVTIVKARVTGRTCSKLTATLTHDNANPASLEAMMAAYGAHATPDGNLTFSGVAPGRYRVSVTCDETNDSSHPPLEVADRDLAVEWRLDPATSTSVVHGAVRDQNGGPVIGAHIVVYAANHHELEETTTSGSGEFNLASLAPGHYTVALLTGGDPASVTRPLELGEGPPSLVTLIMPHATTVVGFVHDQGGQAVHGLIVHLRADRSSKVAAANREAPTSDDGRFELAGVPPGTYSIFATTNTMAWEPPSIKELSLKGEPTVDVDLEVPRSEGKISGIVEDAANAPVTDGYVMASAGNNGLHAADRKLIVTDTTGAFTIDHLGEGSYTLLAFRKGGGHARVEHVAVGSQVVLHLAATGSLRGEVVQANGRPCDHFDVRAFDAARDVFLSETFASSDGSFVIEGVPAVNLHVVVTNGDGSGETQVDVIADRTTTARITLASPSHVTGRVIEAGTKRPLTGVEVAIVRTDGDSPVIGGAGAHVSDADGRFVIGGGPVGEAEVVIEPRKGWRSQRFTRTIQSGDVDLGDIEVAPDR